MPDRPARAPSVVDSATLFGRCVAVMRKDSGLSQAMFAQHLGMSRPALAHIETGRTPPTFFMYLRLAKFVGHRRLDGDVTALHALFHLSAQAVYAQGIRVPNRPRRDTDTEVDIARIDRIVGHIYEQEFQEVVPVTVLTFDGETDDDDEPVRMIRHRRDAD